MRVYIPIYASRDTRKHARFEILTGDLRHTSLSFYRHANLLSIAILHVPYQSLTADLLKPKYCTK